jgi:uncharacterized protein (UPF0276 family)
LPALQTGVSDSIAFFEVSPENWVGVGGGHLRKQFRRLTERHRFVAHDQALSLGCPAPLDTAFSGDFKRFLDHHDFALCTEQLSFCSDKGHFYDLYPIPFTEQGVKHVAGHGLEPSGLTIDTHGQNTIEPVWAFWTKAIEASA